jgi:hypothetical protein
MTDEDDFGSAGYDRLTTLLSGVISAIHDRPADALMLMKEAYAIYQLLPAHERAARETPSWWRRGIKEGNPHDRTRTISDPGRSELRARWVPARGYTTATHRVIYTIGNDASRFAWLARGAHRASAHSCPLPECGSRRLPLVTSVIGASIKIRRSQSSVLARTAAVSNPRRMDQRPSSSGCCSDWLSGGCAEAFLFSHKPDCRVAVLPLSASSCIYLSDCICDGEVCMSYRL